MAVADRHGLPVACRASPARRSGRNSGDRILRELVTANRPLNLVRAKTFFGKLLWDPDCHRPLLRKDAFSLPNSIGQRSNSPRYASISAWAIPPVQGSGSVP